MALDTSLETVLETLLYFMRTVALDIALELDPEIVWEMMWETVPEAAQKEVELCLLTCSRGQARGHLQKLFQTLFQHQHLKVALRGAFLDQPQSCCLGLSSSSISSRGISARGDSRRGSRANTRNLQKHLVEASTGWFIPIYTHSTHYLTSFKLPIFHKLCLSIIFIQELHFAEIVFKFNNSVELFST